MATTAGTVKVTIFPVASRLVTLGVTFKAPPPSIAWVTAKSLTAGFALNALLNVTVIVPLIALIRTNENP